MSREGGAVRHDDVITEPAIVRNMDVSHQEIVASNTRHATVYSRPPMDSHKFSERVVIADLEIGPFSLVLGVLRVLADRGVREDPVSLAELCRPVKDHVRHHFTVLAEFNVLFNHAVRANRDVACKPGFGMNDRSGVGFHEPGLSTIAKRTTASATSFPSTVARPCILPKLLRRFSNCISTWS